MPIGVPKVPFLIPGDDEGTWVDIRVMIHQPATSFFMAPAGNLAMEISLMQDIREIITYIYARRTGKPFAVIWADMERDFFMSATEAKAYGIVDFVGE